MQVVWHIRDLNVWPWGLGVPEMSLLWIMSIFVPTPLKGLPYRQVTPDNWLLWTSWWVSCCTLLWTFCKECFIAASNFFDHLWFGPVEESLYQQSFSWGSSSTEKTSSHFIEYLLCPESDNPFYMGPRPLHWGPSGPPTVQVLGQFPPFEFPWGVSLVTQGNDTQPSQLFRACSSHSPGSLWWVIWNGQRRNTWVPQGYWAKKWLWA